MDAVHRLLEHERAGSVDHWGAGVRVEDPPSLAELAVDGIGKLLWITRRTHKGKVALGEKDLDHGSLWHAIRPFGRRDSSAYLQAGSCSSTTLPLSLARNRGRKSTCHDRGYRVEPQRENHRFVPAPERAWVRVRGLSALAFAGGEGR